jgi:chromosomal replication initiator protein
LAKSCTSDFPADFSFDTFTVAGFNRFAHRVAKMALDSPGRFRLSVLTGPTGVGKTHLLLAVGHAITRSNALGSVCYVTGRDFCDEVNGGGGRAIMEQVLTADTLLIDDFDDIAGHPIAEAALVAVLDRVTGGWQALVAGNRLPGQLGLLPRLESRMRAGLTVPLPLPDLESRAVILRKRAQAAGLQLTDRMIMLLADAASDLRYLVGMVQRMKAETEILGGTLSEELVARWVGETIRNGYAVSTEAIIDHVAAYFGLASGDLTSKSRSRPLVWARQVAQWLTRELTDWSYPAIGRAFGGRDHTTVMHGVEKIARLREERIEVKQLTDTLVGELLAGQGPQKLVVV